MNRADVWTGDGDSRGVSSFMSAVVSKWMREVPSVPDGDEKE